MKHVFNFIFIMTLGIVTASGQISINTNTGGGGLFMDGYFDNYLCGYQVFAGGEITNTINWVEGLSIGVGLESQYGQISFYDLLRESTSGQNFHDHPVDKSEKLRHRIFTLDVPFRIRYNAFGFMGIMAGLRTSFLLDGYVLTPSKGIKSRNSTYERIVPVGEVGLFFSLGEKFSVVTKASKALKDRFFNEYYIDANGNKVGVGVYADYTFTMSLEYRWK